MSRLGAVQHDGRETGEAEGRFRVLAREMSRYPAVVAQGPGEMTKKRTVEVLVLSLVGCYSVPESATPLSAARDGAVVAAAQERWMQEGLPDPSACETLRVLWPATPDQMVHYCKRCSCEAPNCGIPRGCVDACATTIAEGFGPFTTRLPVAVVSRTQPRTSYVHELGHHWQRCLGLPRDHSERFKRWLLAVEKEDL